MYHYVRDQAEQKLLRLREFTNAVGVAIENCAVIGDGSNDLEIFKATGRGVALASKYQALFDAAWRKVDTLTEVIGILDKEKEA